LKRAEPLRNDAPLKPLPTTPTGWTTVLADPPWRFENRTGKVAPEHRRLDRYSTLTLDDVCELPVSNVTASNAHLYLWVPNALMPDGLRVMEAWGFRYVSNIIWAKRRKDGGPDGRGVGFYFRNVTEMILFGVRGSMRTLPPARRQVNMIETRKREHSRKPDEQYDLIESCSPGPYLELFARYPRDGWSVWGDEADLDKVPRGRVHRGYDTEPLPLPETGSDFPSDETAAEAVAGSLRDRYESGLSIRDLANETGYSVARVRSLLARAGTTLRQQGPRRKGKARASR